MSATVLRLQYLVTATTLYVSTNAFTNTVTFDIVNTRTNRCEVMAFDAESWTTALGATHREGRQGF
jgi:hypothetical protein